MRLVRDPALHCSITHSPLFCTVLCCAVMSCALQGSTATELPSVILEAISQVAAPLGGKNARRGAVKEVSGGLEVVVLVYAPTMASAHLVEGALTLTDVQSAMVEILGEKLTFSCRIAWLQFQLEQVGSPLFCAQGPAAS